MGDFDGPDRRYTLRQRLASGRTTELYLAAAHGKHEFEKTVVIKRLLPQFALDAAHRVVFAEEAKLGARLIHAKIAQTIELGRSDNALYMTIEYVDGIDLISVLRELAMRERKLESHTAAWIVHELLDALDYAHNLSHDGNPLGIVHRDVSPGNVLLSVRGDVKLIDFGIARAYGSESGGDRSRAPNGRTGYMSPEQVSTSATDARSDVFSASIILAELLTGHPLFTAPTELELLMMVRDARLDQLDKHGAGIDAGLMAIVRKGLSMSVVGRWQTAAAFRDALSQWLFSNRQRVSSQQIADIVADLRDPLAVVSRTTTPPALPRALSVSIPPRRVAPAQPASVVRKLASTAANTASPPPKLAPDARPARTSTRGKLHAARAQQIATPPEPFRPSSRERLGSTQSPRLTREKPASKSSNVTEVSDGVVDSPAPDRISQAIFGLLETSRRTH